MFLLLGNVFLVQYVIWCNTSLLTTTTDLLILFGPDHQLHEKYIPPLKFLRSFIACYSVSQSVKKTDSEAMDLFSLFFSFGWAFLK